MPEYPGNNDPTAPPPPAMEPPTTLMGPGGYPSPTPPVPPQYGGPPAPPPPPVYGAPPAPYGAPPTGYGVPAPGYPTPPPAPTPTGTNGFAIAALILGIIGGVLLSVIFGFVALSQIKRTGQKGRGMAIAGLIISGAWVVLLCAGVIIAAVFSSAQSRSSSTSLGDPVTITTTNVGTSGHGVNLTELKTGDCIVSVAENVVVQQATVVACNTPHHGEVTGTFTLAGATYPGDDAVAQQAGDRCQAQLKAYSTAAYNDDTLSVFYYAPTSSTWDRNKRVVCIAYDQNHLRTSSVK